MKNFFGWFQALENLGRDGCVEDFQKRIACLEPIPYEQIFKSFFYQSYVSKEDLELNLSGLFWLPVYGALCSIILALNAVKLLCYSVLYHFLWQQDIKASALSLGITMVFVGLAAFAAISALILPVVLLASIGMRSIMTMMSLSQTSLVGGEDGAGLRV